MSVILVLGSHSAAATGCPPSVAKVLGRVFDGALGVRFFFVISGFLITWLMILEARRRAKVNLGHFYARRALRILPVYLAFLGSLALLQCFTPFHQPPLTWVGNLTFTTNFLHDPGASGHLSAHLWSLAVEEQFYLLWPMTFLWLRNKETRRTCLWLVGTALIVVIANRWIERWPGLENGVCGLIFQEWSFFNTVDSLTIGCASALLLDRQRTALEQVLLKRPWLTLSAGLALIQGPYFIHRLGDSQLFHQALGGVCDVIWFGLCRTLQSFGFALVMLHSVLMPQWGPYRVLNLAPVAWVGVLSYSIYIWQQPFFSDPAVFGLPPVWWLSFPCWVVPAVAVAVVSYYGLEKPLLTLRHRFR